MGIPDQLLGERIKAHVVLKEGHDVDVRELRRHLLDKGIASFKMPDIFQFNNELPRTAIGKTASMKLRQEEVSTSVENAEGVVHGARAAALFGVGVALLAVAHTGAEACGGAVSSPLGIPAQLEFQHRAPGVSTRTAR